MLRRLAAAVDPALQLEGIISAAERARHGQQQFPRYLAIGTTALMLAALLLSAASISPGSRGFGRDPASLPDRAASWCRR